MSYCGRTGHDIKVPPHLRKHDCPVYSHTCKHCGCQHHFDHVCRSKGNPNILLLVGHTIGQTHSWALQPTPLSMKMLCLISSLKKQSSVPSAHWQSSTATNPGRHSVTLDHHLYNQLTDTCVKRASKTQPFIKVTGKVSPSDYAAFGFSNSISLSMHGWD